MKNRRPLPIGLDSFRRLREDHYYYADKSMFIADWMEDGAQVTLITRPRRFGKTLNMDMVKEFFDIGADSKAIFQGLAVMDTPFKEQINSRPVIFFSFRDCKGDKPTLVFLIKKELYREYRRFDDIGNALNGWDRDDYLRIIESLQNGDENVIPISQAIAFLSQIVSRHYNKNSIILIDEYDTPMTSAYSEGYYNELRPFFTALYGSALKGNPYLDRSLLTGIQRIAKENIFSGLNNILICTVNVYRYDQYFGFTGQEAAELLGTYGRDLNDDVKAMYDGYQFGRCEMYNPWSLINYAYEGALVPYWVNTSSNVLIRKCILEADAAFFDSFHDLVLNGSTEVSAALDTSFFEISENDTLWGLLLNAGYITLGSMLDPFTGFCRVRIPNYEVKREFQTIVAQYTNLGHSRLNAMFHYLVQERNIPKFVRTYQDIVMTATSFYDAKGNAYHMLMLGMCIYLDRDYEITSNLEAGTGRSDIMLRAKKPGLYHIIIEFKYGSDLKRLSEEALQQIKDRQYAAGLKGEVLLLGIAHDKKKCEIQSELISM